VSEDWPAEGFARALSQADRVVMLYHADWCPFSRIFLPVFEAAGPESSVPFARADLRHPLDPRWDDQGVRVVPTLVYYEKGEELERVDGVRGHGLDRHDMEAFLDVVETLNEEVRPRPRKRRPTARRP
jgi:thiol-disulfide isomerase/thioredoxin